MMSGTIIGEIKMPITTDLCGISGRLKPSAAIVPRVVEMRVAKTAMTRLFLTAPCQLRLVKKSSYHLSE